MEDNGQQDNRSSLDRLEDAWNLMIVEHEEFRAEHKRLLIAQVVMQEKLEETRRLVHEVGDKLNGLIAWSEQTQRENELRFRRLEEKQ
jgi:hypothetical protein